jgi:iron complex transport system permease protein
LGAGLHETAEAVKREAQSVGRWCLALAIATALLLCMSLAMGSTGWMWPGSVVWGADGGGQTVLDRQILWDIRFPRALGAWAVGALLGLGGALCQGLFRNPLAEPYLLGSAAGASLGIALALVGFGASAAAVAWWVRLGLTGAAFVGAVLGVLLTLAVAGGVQHTLRLLLSGVIVGVVLAAVKELMVLSNPQVLQSLQSFSLGTTAFVGWQSLAVLMLCLWPCLAVAWVGARALDALTLGEEAAQSLGMPLQPIRVAMVGVISLATGAAVAQAGLIAFVGLVAPHWVRGMVSVPHRQLVALSAMAGGALLLAADLLARSLVAPQELPVGVITSLLGGGYLLWLMRRRAFDRLAERGA